MLNASYLGRVNLGLGAYEGGAQAFQAPQRPAGGAPPPPGAAPKL